MSSRADDLINEYLDRLDEELAGFEPARRRELVQEISTHIAEAKATLDQEDEVSIRNLLDRIGDPADIAAETGAASAPMMASPAEPVVAESRGGVLEIAALLLLLFGGLLLPVVGWLVGVALLWISSAWTVPQKLLGTLVVPGGLALPLGLGVFASSSATCVQVPIPVANDRMACSSGGGAEHALGTVVIVLLALASLATVVYLARRMHRNAVAVSV